SMHVHVDVEIPKKLDDASRDLLEQLAKVRGEVRVEPHRQQASFFDKIRDTFMG
ncbi:MAG: molecular chaperone DnaJ, partial [Pauljensenia sp.]